MRRPLAKVRYQALLAFGFRAQLQNTLFPEKLHRKPRGHDVGNVLFRTAAELARAVPEDQRVAGFIELVQLTADTRIAEGRAIFEEVDFAAQQRFVVE